MRVQMLDEKQLVQTASAGDEGAFAGFDAAAVETVMPPVADSIANERGGPELEREKAARWMEAPFPMQRIARPSPRIAIKAKGRILFIDPCAVIAVQAEGNYVLLQREGSSYLLRESITDMAAKLEPFGFVRIHRSVLVNSAFVEEIQPCPTGEYDLRVKGGKQFTVTRTYKKNLRSLADFWIGTGAFLTD